MNEKLFNFLDSINTHLRFTFYTKIYPRYAKHYWCKFHDWYTETEKEGWYVLDENGEMIPWVHFDGGIICLYPSMITPIEK